MSPPNPPKRDAFDDAVRILAGRSHGHRELSDKLRRRGHEGPAIEAAFERLLELGYLEPDDEVAARYARELAGRSGATPRWVKHKLAARGFEETDVTRAVEAAFTGWDPREAALAFAAGESNPERAGRRLARRGFPANAVGWVVRQLRRAETKDDA